MIDLDIKDHASFFSGIGGFDLAAEMVGWNNALNCETNPIAQRLLKFYWPNAQQYGNIIGTDFTSWMHRIFCTSGGFPCQSFSYAGLRAGTLDGRYLWPEYFRAICQIKPPAVVGENVAGILTMGEREVFARVDSRNRIRWTDYDQYEAVYIRQEEMLVANIIKDLESQGYRVQLFNIPAAGKGAPHRRERIWFTAYSDEYGSKYQATKENDKRFIEARKKEGSEFDAHGTIRTANDHVWTSSNTNSRRGSENNGARKSEFHDKNRATNHWKDFPTQSPVCGGNDGLPTELDGITLPKWRNESISGYGNAIVPQVAMEIFKAIDSYAS